ncbi:hypothetical protein M0805_005885 [Coniferiporia weirii]|nr:hypothetical protein M0805_005885 [Coniferiporia weirii]
MTTPAKEINLTKPNEFDGTREYASGDWAINRDSMASAYNVDSKGNKLTTIVGYGTWSDFVKDFKSTFITTDDTNEAQQALIKLKQTSMADDFNNQFQSLTTRSGITSPEALMALYQAGLTPALLKSIYNLTISTDVFEQSKDHLHQPNKTVASENSQTTNLAPATTPTLPPTLTDHHALPPKKGTNASKKDDASPAAKKDITLATALNSQQATPERFEPLNKL